MVPAAGALLWALLLSLGPRAAGAQGLTPTPKPMGMQQGSLRFGGPARSRSTGSTARSSLPRKTRIALEDENDALVTADRLAGPAAAELLATVTGISLPSMSGSSQYEDGSLEEGVVINARKTNTSPGTPSTSPATMGGPTTGRTAANIQEPEIRLTSSLPSPSSSTGDMQGSEATLNKWSTAGSTPKRWPSLSPTAMPPPEDLHVVLMPWGPWHCHCKSGTMSRSRAGKLQGLSGRLRIGALNQLRTEHRPCTYHQCPCNRLREECPLDSSLCADNSCSSQTTTTQTTISSKSHIKLRQRPIPPSPSPALAFWKRVRIGLEDIWNSLSSVFTEMEPTDKTRR